MKLPLKSIKTPAYVADIAAIKRNLQTVQALKEKTGCKVILALKAFSMFSVFDIMRDAFDGTTASGFYEAKLGHEEFGKEVHAYSPAFTEEEIEALIPICNHIYFNSVHQLESYAPRFRKHWGDDCVIGLRVNPQFSLVKNNAIYDPSSPTSRFGVQAEELTDDVIAQIDLLHIHNLCENLSNDSVALVEHVSKKFAHVLRKVKYVNFGGGHYINHKNYDIDALANALNNIQKEFDITALIEPGGATVYQAGYLVASVIDIIENGGQKIAILDTSATCHMPDVLEVPYTPEILGAAEKGKKKYDYIVAGKTCLTGDIIGEYSFDTPLEKEQKLIFGCMMQYTMVKNTTFNGTPLPDIGILNEDGSYKVVKSFGYEDFKERLS